METCNTIVRRAVSHGLSCAEKTENFGRARIHEGDDKALQLIRKFNSPGQTTPAERAILIEVEAFDWNCPQHITARYTQEELVEILDPIRSRLRDLEKENAEFEN